MTLATSPKPEPRLRRGNVYLDRTTHILDRTTHILGGIGRDLVGLSNDLAFRDTLSAADLAEVRTRLASALASLNEVATEANGADSGLLLDGASWDDRNALSTKRKGN